MKHFATVLRNRALGKQTDNLMSKNLVFYFSRRQLIEMVTRHFDGTIPKQHDLVSMENRELLGLIDNELFIISYVTGLWSKEAQKEEVKKEGSQANPNPQKPRTDDKRTDKASK